MSAIATKMRELAEKATPGPWAHEVMRSGDLHGIKTFGGYLVAERWTDMESETDNNISFLAACREGVPQLCAELTRLTAEVAELRSNEAAYERIVGKKTYQEVADEIAILREENERLRTDISFLEDPVYCTKCGSCGEEGCCPAEKCMYPGYAAGAFKDRAESVERTVAELRPLANMLLLCGEEEVAHMAGATPEKLRALIDALIDQRNRAESAIRERDAALAEVERVKGLAALRMDALYAIRKFVEAMPSAAAKVIEDTCTAALTPREPDNA